MPAYAALLRAVNLAGRNRVPMAELRERLTALGLDDVATHLQSGNVVFRTSRSAKDVAAAIEKEVAGAFGVRSTVILRTAAQLRKVAGSNPFAGARREGEGEARPGPLARRPLRTEGPRALPPPAERLRAEQAHGRLPREDTRHEGHGTQLGDRDEARRAHGRIAREPARAGRCRVVVERGG
jgi:uncharacterized protein (DUF1697 family)